MSGHRRDPKIPQEKTLPNGWIVVPSKTYPDRVYFYNTVTRCSTWNNPCEVSQSKASQSIGSKASSPSGTRSSKKSFEAAENNQKQYKLSLHSPDESSSTKADSEIEDYDEQHDQYFNNVSNNAFSLSHSNFISPSSSPDSVSSLKTDVSNSESSKYNSLLENNEKQLLVHFVSTPPKSNVRKSVALNDYNEPSTSVLNVGMETIKDNENKVHLPQTFSKGSASKYSATSETEKKKSKKKKHKEFDSGSQKKRIEDKIIKTVSFKKKDKTPAQSRLLKLRKQNAEKLKELALKNPDLFSSKINLAFGKATNSKIFVDDRQDGSDSFSEAHLKRIDMCNNLTEEAGNHSKDEFSEEMDWEPSNEESDVRNINEFRQQLDKVNSSSSDIFFGLKSDHSIPQSSKTHYWFVVLDTNIFVSCLGFVKDLRDMKVQNLGSPIIYVPWRVLQELDHLKDTRIDGMNKRLHINVRKAISYLNENFKLRHPRVFGQSFEDFAKMVGVEATAPDDEILQTCLTFQRLHPDKKLMLLTNDKNLESKAIVSGIEVYSKDRFQEKYLKSKPVSPTFNGALNKAVTSRCGPNTKTMAVDNSLCEIKSILKDFIPLVVETEMKIAFEGDWVKLAFKKPPWNLQDALDCLFKHWRSVFFLVFPKETQTEGQRLYDWLFKKEADSIEDLLDIISVVQGLIFSIKKSQNKKRPYLDLIEVTSIKLSNIQNLLSSNLSTEVDSCISPSLFSSESTPGGSFFHSQVSQNKVPIDDVSRVKNLFKDIWDSLRNFWSVKNSRVVAVSDSQLIYSWQAFAFSCSVSGIIHSSSACESTGIQEVRPKVSEIIGQVTELIVIIEKIFEISPTDINESHPLINHLSNFLISVHPAMDPDLKRELHKCLAAFFTDFEGRYLLNNSLKDFKEFSHDLMNATDFFNTHLTG